ncbi:MAG: AraC family transcriptional regulator [Lactobacillus acidophilus]
MNAEILKVLRKNNDFQNWEEIKNRLHPIIIKHVEGEPVYQFFDTLNDNSFEKNGQLISLSTQPINSFVPYHIHNYVEMMVVLSGSCVIKTANEAITLNENEIIIIGCKTIHKVEPIDDKTIMIKIALKRAAFSLEDLVFLTHSHNAQSVSSIVFSLLSSDDSHGAFNVFRTHHDVHVVNKIYNIISEYYCPDDYSNQIIKLEILELFIRLIRIASKDAVFQTQKEVQNNNEIDLLTLLLYIERNYKTINLKSMAKYFNFNPNYLSSILREKTGYTFIKLVHLQRINVAAEYLALTNTPVEGISLAVGYENPTYFYKMFKKYMGCSPKEYRQKQIAS